MWRHCRSTAPTSPCWAPSLPSLRTDPVLGPAIPADFFAKNVLASADLVVPADQGLIDLVSGEGMARAHGAIMAASRASGIPLTDYDASTLLSATSRTFTQSLSRVVFEY